MDIYILVILNQIFIRKFGNNPKTFDPFWRRYKEESNIMIGEGGIPLRVSG